MTDHDACVEITADEEGTLILVIPCRMMGLGLILAGVLVHNRLCGHPRNIDTRFDPAVFPYEEQGEIRVWASDLYALAMAEGPPERGKW